MTYVGVNVMTWSGPDSVTPRCHIGDGPIVDFWDIIPSDRSVHIVSEVRLCIRSPGKGSLPYTSWTSVHI